MPTLNWAGKDKVINHHLDVPMRVLERVYTFGPGAGIPGDAGILPAARPEAAPPGSAGILPANSNMVIHGDNLAALKALLPRYEGRVDCVYIDPPYNTGNEGWVYNDNVNDPQIRKWLGEVVGKEGEDFSRHDKWLCMMYPRLRLLHRLLANDGVIFISIDDNELCNLKLVCDEIFGATCFVADISWQRTYSTRNDSKGIVSEVEHILAYSKTPGWQPAKLPRTAEMDKKYKNPDGDPNGVWRSDNAYAPNAATHQGMVYAIQHPFTGELLYPTPRSCWRYEQAEMLAIMNGWCPYELRDIGDDAKRAEICGVGVDEVRKGVQAIMLKDLFQTGFTGSTGLSGVKPQSPNHLVNPVNPVQNIPSSFKESKKLAEEVLKKGPWPRFFFSKNGKGGIARKTYLDKVGGIPPTNLWEYKDVGHTDEAKKELMAIFNGKSPFDTPKPVRLLERILAIVGKKDALVLDSFAGSGTTAHAVLKLNAEDGGNRRFILVEMMDYAESITAERVKRVMDSLAANAGGSRSCATESERTRGSASLPGFDYYELGPALMDGDALNENLPVGKIREYVWWMETRGMGNVEICNCGNMGLWNYGNNGDPIIPQSHNPTIPQSHNDYLLGVADGTAYYFCYEPGRAVALNRALLRKIGTKAEAYVIYADRCLLDEATLRRLRITFKKIPRDIARL